ncbi:hypothetical protein [Microbacterium sp. NPDC089695]|uniref:hypothetical protein n=1 Tax=Microbacterium sp. NPDC089695 TaxID=3364198 RepID=UPI00380F9A9E
MKRSAFSAAVSVVIMIAMLTACGAPAEVIPQPTFTPLGEAPEVPPAVAIDGTPVTASYYEWIIDREPVTFKAAEDQDDVVLPTVFSDDANAITVEVGSPVTPADFVVVVFDEIDPSGKPVESSAQTIDCLRDADRCTVVTADAAVSATVDARRSSDAIVVVHLMYVSDARDEQQVDHVVGAWGARVGT